MASKNAKPGPKPKRDNKKVDPEKQPKEKPPVEKKKEGQIENEIALEEVKKRVNVLQSALVGLQAQIEVERAGAIPKPSALQAEVDCAKAEWERIQSELSQSKRLSRKRKNEIDEWKAWYDKRPSAEKQKGLEKLQSEIKWRADELASNGEKINILIPKELEAREIFEMAQQKREAFRAGVHHRPIEEDPRLKSLRAELKNAEAVLDWLEPERPKQK